MTVAKPLRPEDARRRLAYVVVGSGDPWATFSADRVARQRREGDVVERVWVDVAGRASLARGVMDPVAGLLMDRGMAGWQRKVDVHVVLRDGAVVSASLDAPKPGEKEAAAKRKVGMCAVSVVPCRRVAETLRGMDPLDRLCLCSGLLKGEEHAMVGLTYRDREGQDFVVVQGHADRGTVDVAHASSPFGPQTEALGYVARMTADQHPHLAAASRLLNGSTLLAERLSSVGTRLALQALDDASFVSVQRLQRQIESLLKEAVRVERGLTQDDQDETFDAEPQAAPTP